MGNFLLSVIFSVLYVQNYESMYILNYKIYNKYIKVYFKYVNDIFVLFKVKID